MWPVAKRVYNKSVVKIYTSTWYFVLIYCCVADSRYLVSCIPGMSHERLDPINIPAVLRTIMYPYMGVTCCIRIIEYTSVKKKVPLTTKVE